MLPPLGRELQELRADAASLRGDVTALGRQNVAARTRHNQLLLETEKIARNVTTLRDTTSAFSSGLLRVTADVATVRNQVSDVRVQGPWCTVRDPRVQGLGSKVQGLGSRVQTLESRV